MLLADAFLADAVDTTIDYSLVCITSASFSELYDKLASLEKNA